MKCIMEKNSSYCTKNIKKIMTYIKTYALNRVKKKRSKRSHNQ